MALLWLWIFNPDYGLLNGVLTAVHLPPGSWLASPDQSKNALLIMVLGGTVGSVMVVMPAGLQDVPASPIQAAGLDGAHARRGFWHRVLASLGPVVFFNPMTRVGFF